MWHFTSGWRYSSASSWLLAKMVHVEGCAIIGFDLNIKSEAGCIYTCVVWCEANNIPDDVICATMPRETDGFGPKFTAYL